VAAPALGDVGRRGCPCDCTLREASALLVKTFEAARAPKVGESGDELFRGVEGGRLVENGLWPLRSPWSGELIYDPQQRTGRVANS